MIPCRHVRPSPQRALLGVAAMAYAVGLLLATPAEAIHRQTEFLVNPSGFSKFVGGNSQHPAAAKGEPGWVAFESTSDLLGNGSVGRQIFLFDMHKPRSLGQITHHNGDSANPSLSKEGAFVVFDSAADILQTGSTARQIYLWEKQSQQFVQLTFGQRDSIKADISQDISTVVFESTADLAFTGSTDSQIFLYDLHPTANPVLTQVTHGPGTAHNVVQDDLGQFLFFDSDEALDGPSNGSRQIFMYDRHFNRYTQLTNGVGDSIMPSVDFNATVVAFQSTADLLNNGSTGRQVFMLEPKTGLLRQLTQSTLGESFHASIERFDRFVSFLSTADLLATGYSGQHAFVFHTATALTFQITSKPGGFTDNNNTVGNFVLLDTDEDLMKNGATGRQVYTVDLWRKEPHPKPKEFIGRRTFNLLDGGSSHVDVTTRDGTAQAALTGQMVINLDGRNWRGEAPIEIGKKNVTINPIVVPGGFGTICISMTGPGQGVYDSYGGRPGGDLLVTQDHDQLANDPNSDPGCATGCPDGPDARTCPGFLPGPHVGLCRGPVLISPQGTYAPGGMRLRLPLNIKVSREPGIDLQDCTVNDRIALQLDTVLELTSGSAISAILDADAVPGAQLLTSAGGVAFDARHLEVNNITGKLVGVLPFLDIPGVPTGAPGVMALRDLLITVHVEPDPVKPYVPACTGLACKILTVCTNDQECEDSDVCNGTETCVAGTCTPGAIPTCAAAGPCQFGYCDPTAGCQYLAIPNCCVNDADCNDGNLCNGTELCNGGNCVSGPGTIVCDDKLACNGEETCDPGTGTCVGGVPTAPFTKAGVICRLDEIVLYITKFDPRDMGGALRVKRLLNMVKLIRKGMLKPTPDCRGSKRRLHTLANLLDRAVRQGTIASVIAEPLVDMVKNESLRVAHVCVNAPQP